MSTPTEWRMRLVFFLGDNDLNIHVSSLEDSVCLTVNAMVSNGPEAAIFFKPQHLPRLREIVEALESVALEEVAKKSAEEPCRPGAIR